MARLRVLTIIAAIAKWANGMEFWRANQKLPPPSLLVKFLVPGKYGINNWLHTATNNSAFSRKDMTKVNDSISIKLIWYK